MTAYKYGLKTLYYANTDDGDKQTAMDQTTDEIKQPIVEESVCESGACAIWSYVYMKTVLNKKNIDQLRNPMFLGEDLSLQRYDKIRYTKFYDLYDQQLNFF